MNNSQLAESVDDTLERLISMTNQTCLVALDKTIAAIKRSPGQYTASAERVSNIAERVHRAVYEIAMTLPPEKRTIK